MCHIGWLLILGIRIGGTKGCLKLREELISVAYRRKFWQAFQL